MAAGPIIKGTAVVFSTGVVTGLGGDGFLQSLDCERSSEKREIMDTGGAIRSVPFFGFRKTLKGTLIIKGATISAARSQLDAIMQQPGASAVVVDEFGAIVSDTYNLDRVGQARKVDDAVSVSVEFSRGDEGFDTTTLVT